jgi:diguanylate cyclase (GGDEF)-like protein
MDPVTQVWNRQNFEVKLQEEMSRSRRTHLPVSMVIASVDEFKKIRQQNGQEVSDLLLRSVAGMIRRNSRVNDVVGRLSDSEIALLLPHTGSRGGAIKAERLRRMVEAADFTKLFGSAVPITISLGVSEYPSVCHDADELLRSADDALFQVKDIGSNKVCLAPVPEGFVADFEVGQR